MRPVDQLVLGVLSTGELSSLAMLITRTVGVEECLDLLMSCVHLIAVGCLRTD